MEIWIVYIWIKRDPPVNQFPIINEGVEQHIQDRSVISFTFELNLYNFELSVFELTPTQLYTQSWVPFNPDMDNPISHISNCMLNSKFKPTLAKDSHLF